MQRTIELACFGVIDLHCSGQTWLQAWYWWLLVLSSVLFESTEVLCVSLTGMLSFYVNHCCVISMMRLVSLLTIVMTTCTLKPKQLSGNLCVSQHRGLLIAPKGHNKWPHFVVCKCAETVWVWVGSVWLRELWQRPYCNHGVLGFVLQVVDSIACFFLTRVYASPCCLCQLYRLLELVVLPLCRCAVNIRCDWFVKASTW